MLKTDDWIINGNYQRTLEMRLKECDTVFLLDFPTQVYELLNKYKDQLNIIIFKSREEADNYIRIYTN